ncbi:DEAD/DEAH box helicase [Nocardia asteroides]|uniref:DEAD/DEAH box helicase n=1 Tax=Nocardia asteroides TaxID=1824 RepID=UPI003400F113
MGNELTDLIVDLLRVQPNLSAPEIAEALAEPGVNRSVVNRLLYAEWAIFEQVGSTAPPRWALKGVSAGLPDTAAPVPSSGLAPDREPRTLRAWQRRAHAEWTRNGRKGIVEAVGGTGKTVLGARIVADAVASNTPAVVVVADDEVRARWLDELSELAPDCKVTGLSSSPRQSSERTWQVAIVTASTITRLRQIASPAQCSNGLLVVDDIDRYANGVFGQVLTDQFTARLALTRALDHDDQTVRSRLLPYFGPAVTGCDYPTAHAQALLAPVTVIHVGVELDAKEHTRLAHLDSLIDRESNTLIDSYGAPGESAEFRAFVDVLATGRGSGAHHANRYVAAVSDRATLLAECRAKTDLVGALPAEVMTAAQSIVFTDRPVSASQVHRALTAHGIPAATTATTLTGAQRTAIAQGLHDRSFAVLVEQRVLDPAVTVPRAEIAVVLAHHRNRTQLIQRLSRVLRPAGPTRRTLVINVFVSGSVEDPGRDGASLVASIGPLATEIVRTDPGGLIAYLRTWHGSKPEPASVPGRLPELREPSPPTAPADQAGAAAPGPVEPVAGADPAPDSSPADSDDSAPGAELAAFLTELTNLGQIATGEEVGDLIGHTDPGDLRLLAEAAARGDQLVFAEFGGDSDDLLLLRATSHTEPQQLRAAVSRITSWADSADDPVGDIYRLMSDLNGVRVPPHRLVQIAAFVRGTTPKALL